MSMADTASIREWLDDAGFDWNAGRIVYHETSSAEDRENEMEPSPGWADRVGPGVLAYHPIGERAPGQPSHPILDHRFHTGFGGPMCPRFIAQDPDALYFPSQYDGATRLVKVYRHLIRYVGHDAEPTPYPGG